jgi:hypothetical protein
MDPFLALIALTTNIIKLEVKIAISKLSFDNASCADTLPKDIIVRGLVSRRNESVDRLEII